MEGNRRSCILAVCPPSSIVLVVKSKDLLVVTVFSASLIGTLYDVHFWLPLYNVNVLGPSTSALGYDHAVCDLVHPVSCRTTVDPATMSPSRNCAADRICGLCHRTKIRIQLTC